MAKVEMSLTQALVEVKKMKDRLNRKITINPVIGIINPSSEANRHLVTMPIKSSPNPILYNNKSDDRYEIYDSKAVSSAKDETDLYKKWESELKGNLSSILSIWNNYVALKKAISQANAVTTVNICGVDITIAEAMALKSNDVISSRKRIIDDCLLYQLNFITSVYNELMEKVNSSKSVNEYISIVSGESDLDKIQPADLKKLEKQYHDLRDFKLFDPLGLKDLVEKMTTDYENFVNEIDFKLAEVNSRTMIEVEYKDSVDFEI